MLNDLTTGTLTFWGLSLVIFYCLSKAVYNLTLHPLARFPGPKAAAISHLWFVTQWRGGRLPFRMQELHRNHGDVVRIGPNDLSFATAGSYRDIYGTNAGGTRRALVKGTMYEQELKDIGNTREVTSHARLRNILSPGFSARALTWQEGIVQKYVDLLIEQIKAHSREGPVNIVDWFEWMSFDIIGDLTFAESFDALKHGKPLYWIKAIPEATKFMLYKDMGRRLPFLHLFTVFILTRQVMDSLMNHYKLIAEKTRKRLALKTDRQDFLTYCINAKELNEQQLIGNGNALLIAGSETTATSLGTLTYYLCKNPEKLAKLKEEVRTSFKSNDEINGISTAKLPYLVACIKEGLRIFPPSTYGLPRISHGVVIDGHYVPNGTTVATEPFTVARDPRYWKDPNSFLPERWLESDSTDNREASQPFSLGPRACMGINLAYLEMRIVLARMIYTFDWEWVNKDLDWESESRVYWMWQKPDLMMQYRVVH